MTLSLTKLVVAVLLPAFYNIASAQKIGSLIPEVHPKLTTQFCTKANGCVTRQTSLVLDALSRDFHASGNPSVSCLNPTANKTLCPDPATCASNCELEGVEYGSQGILTSGSALTMRMYLYNGTGYTKASPRVYLLSEDDNNYEMLKLVNQEFTYDVDMSQLGCGMNGALYMVEMDASGSKSAMNPAGARYGTGYCDAQCFNKTWINGMPNMNNSGACCNEMDIWEANSQATALTPHTCSGVSSFLCTGDQCGKTDVGVCDKSGCGINPYSTGAKDFYGPGKTVDTTKPFTVVTQFVSAGNSSSANGASLSEIRRLYVQNGTIIENAPVNMNGKVAAVGAVNQDFCTSKKADSYLRLGGMNVMGQSLARGMVLAFSVWNSDGDFMKWLDQGSAGPCNSTAGDPKSILANNPNLAVMFSNIKWGDIGSTFNGTGPTLKASAVEGAEVSKSAGSFVVAGAWLGLTFLCALFAVSF